MRVGTVDRARPVPHGLRRSASLPPSIPQLQTLLGRPLFVTSVVGVLLVVLVVVGWLRRRRAEATASVLAWTGLLVTVGGVLSLTLFGPLPRGVAEPRLFLDPMAGAWGWDSIAWRPVVDNVALFLPLGAMAGAAFRRRGLVTVWLLCVAFSVAIEAFQYLVPTGRVANTADVLANAAGALLGLLLAVASGARAGGPSAALSGSRPRSGARVP